ncbi:unnamed protein product [Spirodela intermedia]|uniref:Uncharacterized protein n=1 Tax=Spirodela intermedia TaxID=51605 RepID=A0A7I8JE09_SPIIN|nr:unnamed protein product [Spirodela intermedia]CAA6667773.1 unnamed protein product [Spirodela intermedia]
MARRTLSRPKADGGKSLKVSEKQRRYGCCGLKMVACGSLDLCQYSTSVLPGMMGFPASSSARMQPPEQELRWPVPQRHHPAGQRLLLIRVEEERPGYGSAPAPQQLLHVAFYLGPK